MSEEEIKGPLIDLKQDLWQELPFKMIEFEIAARDCTCLWSEQKIKKGEVRVKLCRMPRFVKLEVFNAAIVQYLPDEYLNQKILKARLAARL
jgi:hypothetical protein